MLLFQDFDAGFHLFMQDKSSGLWKIWNPSTNKNTDANESFKLGRLGDARADMGRRRFLERRGGMVSDKNRYN